MISSIRARLACAAGLILVPAFSLGGLFRVDSSTHVPPLVNRYIGAAACKNCHKAKEKGEQYVKWEESKHSKTFDVLASPEAKEAAAKLGVTEPQKDPKCLQCHVTAFDKNKRDIKQGFKPEMGVQCESCHGPGEQHAKARFAAAANGEPQDHVVIPADEIVIVPEVKTCLECHNDKSPTFKPFCFKERWAKISHLDPRKDRTEAQLAAMKCDCGEKCGCTQAECGGHDAVDAPKDAPKEAAPPAKDAKGDGKK